MARTSHQQTLPLTTAGGDWRLDDRTREVGRRGVADARAALVAATRRAEARDAARRVAEAA